MKIGIIIGRIGDVDGVALETEKWIHVLEKMGHEIYLLSGRFKEHVIDPSRETLLRPLSFFSPECEWEQNRAFFFPQSDPSELISHLEEKSTWVAKKIFEWIVKNRLEVVVAENSAALPCHLSMGMGIKKVVENTNIRVITHDHDFYWERGERYDSPHPEITRIVQETFPLQQPSVRHAVINSYNQKELKKRFNADAVVVPNVMNFDGPYGVLDDYNRDMRQALGLKDECVPLFQITRVVRRKGIETAIDLVHKLDDSRFKLVVTGSYADDERKGYYKELVDRVHRKNLQEQVIFGHHIILSQRGTAYEGHKIYSLEDAYAHATACTYFSTYEGFGNAFVECCLARRPIFVNNYKPVYWPDIGSKGFRTVQLEGNVLTEDAVNDVREILTDDKLASDIAEHNYNLAKKHFSYEVLEEKLTTLLNF